MSADTLLKAIKVRWENDPQTVELITGGLHLSQVPEKKGSTRLDIPYAVCDVGKTRFIWTMSEVSAEINDIEFTLFFAGSGVSLEQILAVVRLNFDWCTLTFSDNNLTSVYFQPIDSDITCEPVKYRDGSMIYRATVSYEAFVSRTLPHYP